MPKHGKTRKAIAKRFKIKKTGKVLHRTSGQDHFNSRERSKVTRNKRSDREIFVAAIAKTIKLAIHK